MSREFLGRPPFFVRQSLVATIDMPELPEVETVVRQLRPQLVGRRLRGIRPYTPGVIRCQAFPKAHLVGATMLDVRRRGKFIRCDLMTGPHRRRRTCDRLTLLVHLGMTGQLTVLDAPSARGRHDHLDLLLNGRDLVRFRDARRFGGWWLLPSQVADSRAPLADLGPEPLEVSRKDFRRLLAGHRQQIKALLLNQRRLAGMGNIYCDESLFAAAIHPQMQSCDIAAPAANGLWRHIRRILRAAVRRRGSTIATFCRPDGGPGEYQDRFKVYGMAGRPCVRCGTTLRRLLVAGRGTTLCPTCQGRP